MCSLSFEFPFQMPHISEEPGTLSSLRDITPHLFSLSPHSNATQDLWAQSVCIRGNRELFGCHDDKPRPDLKSALTRAVYESHPTTNSQLSMYQTPLLLATPFPQIFTKQNTGTSTISSYTTLQSHSGIEEFFKTLHREAKSVDIRRVPVYHSTCLDADSHQEMLVKLQEIKDLYHVGLNSSDDSTDEEN
ncbi:PREDICTED: uncharacterized protein LOC109591752 [Amphimedon queenslandica]|uniref:Uncharacterized protein n=1 Tax=Amphimedon queenslandica TaxID=400682 RepID=A0A1X7SS13_AMPQE|nr:PREDICTED: uncharacterized protein LOC109591752 [Amphimedon queenslandica]|eukprot:XP_019862968.1 PREDICTED: uncharacterized protein LOC109591752 [Amphimedon queenslandica]